MPYNNNEPVNQAENKNFAAACREALIVSYETHLEGHVPAAYKDKPLPYFGVDFTKRHMYDDDSPGSLAREYLDVTPLTLEDVARMKALRATRDLPLNVHDYYHTVAATIGSVALGDSLRLRQFIPPNGVVGQYTASFSNENMRIVDSLCGTADQKSLIHATKLAKRAIKYMQTGESRLTVENKLLRAIKGQTDDVLQHSFTIKMVPDLPLNGYEGEQFLIKYRDKMHLLLQQRRQDLEYLFALGSSETTIEKASEQVELYLRALKRVQDILKDK